MKFMISVIALIVSVGAASLAGYSYTKVESRPKGDYGTSDPADVVSAIMAVRTDDAKFSASQAYLVNHQAEIMETLEVSDVSVSEDHGIAFFRYSIGSRIFREAYWLGRVSDRWYLIPHLSKYSDSKPSDMSWFEEMMSRKEKWEEESAVKKF